MPFDPEKIPTWLRRTPEQQAQDERYQEQLKQAAGPGRRPNPTEAHLLRAAAVRRSAEAQLNYLIRLDNANPEHVTNAKAQLADALAAQGHFSDAAEIHPGPEHAAHYRALAEAIERPDDDPGCNCQTESRLDETQNRQVPLLNEIVSEFVFSPKHGKLMPVVKCTKCGDLNVKPAPERLARRLQRVQEEHHRARKERSHVTP
jgi:hypothetical protein